MANRVINNITGNYAIKILWKDTGISHFTSFDYYAKKNLYDFK